MNPPLTASRQNALQCLESVQCVCSPLFIIFFLSTSVLSVFGLHFSLFYLMIVIT